jgi:ferric-dicitrate binding protein FerR (iron transport regulator)
MSNDDDMLEAFDLSAWEAPPPPADLADGVIDRMGATDEGTDVGLAAVALDHHRAPRRGWIIAGAAAATFVLAIGVWTLIRATHHAAPSTGSVVADQARTLALETVHANLDPGADVRWRRDGDVLRVEQRAGSVTWRVDSDQQLVIDAGAASASVEATGANLRVEVQMNATDAKVIGGAALTAAAVAIVTVVVYEGHVKVGKASQQTVVVAPGSTYKVNAVDDTASVVGAGLTRSKKVAILGLETGGVPNGHVPVVAQALSSAMRAVAANEGPYTLAPVTRELVDEKLLANCATEAPQCMSAIGANLGADLLVYGHLELGKRDYTTRLVLLDVAKKTIERTQETVWPIAGTERDMIDWWGRRFYLDLIGVPSCDADALKDEGMQQINAGQHAAALTKFEQSLACKDDSYVRQLAFMESCASANPPRAKQHYKRLTPVQQGKFRQMCIRNKVELEDPPVASAAIDCPGVDEVSCVLSNYEGDCCKKYLKSASKPDGLTRAQISEAIAKVKPQIMKCKTPSDDKVVVRVEVKPSGDVTSVTMTTSADAELSKCVRSILAGAKFPATKIGGSFSYPFVFSGATAPAQCDADALKEEGMQNINMGQHAAALTKFEKSLACKEDPYVTQLAFMEACASRNSAKAQLYYKRMTPTQQSKFSQMCERENVAYLPGEGYLQVFSKPAAKILVDGRDTGMTTPITGQQLALVPGKHKITFVVGDDHFTYPVQIKAGETLTMSKDLQ